MIRCMCLVQEGQAPDNKREVLVEKLNSFTQASFNEDADVYWHAIPQGSGYTAAKPSTSSIVSVTAPKPLSQAERIPLLNEICELWMNETGCSINEVVASMSDPRTV